MMCNPKGLVRLFMYTDPAEFIHTAKGDLILMSFQSQGSTRSIWMDGRALPVNPTRGTDTRLADEGDTP